MRDTIDRTTVLVASGEAPGLALLAEALRVHGAAVLVVREIEQARGALETGFGPDVVIVGMGFGTRRVSEFLHSLVAAPATREIPVLASSEGVPALFQIAPRHQQRKIPIPETAAAAHDFLAVFGSRRATPQHSYVMEDTVIAPHREVHYMRDDLREPPCETLEDYFDWSDDIDDVTCARCREVLAGADARSAAAREPDQPGA